MTAETFLNGRVTLHGGDNREVLKSIPDCSIDSIVTDPPYALVSIVKRFANSPRSERTENTENPYGRTGRGFMGQKWDNGETAFAVEFWAECLRVLKPGGHVVAFSGTRTYHRMACAIEDAGFEVRDMLQYLYGSGFPKSHNVTRGLGDAACHCEATSERNLRSVRSPDVSTAIDLEDQRGEVLLAGLPEQGPHGAMLCQDCEEGKPWREESGMEGRGDLSEAPRQLRERPLRALPLGIDLDGAGGWLHNGASAGDGALDRASVDAGRVRPPSRSQTAKQHAHKSGDVAGQSEPQTGGAWEDCGRCGKPMVPAGWGTALKPACEPICFGRKPLTGTVAQNVLEYGTGAINIDGCRVEGSAGTRVEDKPRDGGVFAGKQTRPYIERALAAGEPARSTYETHSSGRWPANIIHDGSEEVLEAFPQSDGATSNGKNGVNEIYGGGWGKQEQELGYNDSGSAARFFYTAKADASDRIGSKHPTVKPVDLMQWLCRLVTPKGGTVLDPFAGTGTTGEAAFREGMLAVLVEREEEYQADIRRRMGLVLAGPDERSRESIKARTAGQPIDAGPLFAGSDTPPAWEGKSTESSRTNHRADGTEAVTE